MTSDYGSLTSYLLKWADVQLNKLAIMYILTFTRDSEELCRVFQQHSPLQPGYYMFIADTVAMYTNIDQYQAKKLTMANWY